LLTALAAMQMGVMDEKTIFPCGGGFYYKGKRIKGHGGADPLIPSIQVSSNCFFTYAFIAIIKKYPGNPSRGVDEWKKIMSSFGVGEFLNNDFAVGARGRIPSGDFYENRFKAIMKASGSKRTDFKNWDEMSTGAIYNGMGQGDVLVTPLQLANYVSAIANKGWYYTPHIVKAIDGKPNPDPRFKKKHQTLVDKKHFDPVLRGMEAVVLNGTARGLKSSDFTQLAKTGTAQVPQGKDNSIFVLIAPADKPKIVVAAVMEHAGFGATWAGPAATIIAEKYITGDIKREHLYKKMVTSSFMPEYKRQWIADLKRKGLYKPSEDSIKQKRILDSLKLIKEQKAKMQKKAEEEEKNVNKTKPAKQ
jgi:penicillin-binding protein 2